MPRDPWLYRFIELAIYVIRYLNFPVAHNAGYEQSSATPVIKVRME